MVTTLAGNGYLMTTTSITFPIAWADGLGSNASLSVPTYLALDGRGNVVVGDLANNRIRLLSAVGGIPLCLTSVFARCQFRVFVSHPRCVVVVSGVVVRAGQLWRIVQRVSRRQFLPHGYVSHSHLELGIGFRLL